MFSFSFGPYHYSVSLYVKIQVLPWLGQRENWFRENETNQHYTKQYDCNNMRTSFVCLCCLIMNYLSGRSYLFSVFHASNKCKCNRRIHFLFLLCVKCTKRAKIRHGTQSFLMAVLGVLSVLPMLSLSLSYCIPGTLKGPHIILAVTFL